MASTVTPSTEVLQKTAATNYEKAREAFGGAQEVQSQLTSMEDSFRKLNASGWSSTGTGAEAIEQARRHQPDLVLMDIRMPDMDGIEATRQLTRTRVLILTTFGLDEYIIQALRAGASGYQRAPAPNLRNPLRMNARSSIFLNSFATLSFVTWSRGACLSMMGKRSSKRSSWRSSATCN